MTQQYLAGWRFRNVFLAQSLLLAVLSLLLGGRAQAQSGPYGNEWIVAGQPYYKVKVWRDGIYRLDYTYLQSLSGAAGIAPTRFQVWRRGKEVALYQGGNQATLDATSYLEFYGQRNDGVLDREFYKDPNEQAHKYYSFYTDTAAYFITWGTRAGKRMAQPTAAGGTPHAWRMQTVVKVATDRYFEAPTASLVHMPWLNSSEGFFSLATPRPGYGGPLVLSNDSLLRALVTTGGAPPIRAEVCLIGGSIPSAGGGVLGQHNGSVLVGPPGGTPRQLGVLTFMNYDYKRGYYVLNPSDIGSTGKVEISSAVVGQRNATPVDVIAQSYMKLTAAQQNVWFSDRRSLWFQNDSLLSGPATYELDNIPATVVGYDIHDPYNVQRVAPTAAQTLGSTGRRFVFPAATNAETRRLYLADATVWLTPAAPRRVNFKTINPATPNFVIITHPKLMKAAGTVPNAALEYAKYRASTVGGAYDTLIVTAPQLYDQFHYGERSVIALRHFALWLANAAPATQTKYLLLLGKGIGSGVTPGMIGVSRYFGVDANYTTRRMGDMGLDLVPTSTHSASDNFLSADWPNDNLVAKLPTGRVPAATPQEVMTYLAKLREHEALGIADWRKNVLHLAGGLSPSEYVQFGGYLDGHAKRVPRPLLGGNVKTIRKSGPDPVVTANIANELNGGLSVIQYFGHGSPNDFNLEIGDINDPATNYHNAGRYPVLMYNGCEAGDSFFTPMTFGPSWLLASQKGSVGMLSQSCEAYAYLLDPAQDMMYKLLFNDPDWFGQPVARVYGEMVRRMQTDTRFQGNPAGTEQLLATTWMGDPALRLFAPAKPDFIASNATLSVVPAAASSTISPTAPFALKIGVSNPARITTDSIEIRVTRTYDPSTGRAQETRMQTFRQAWVRDTTYTFGLDNTGNVYGFNTFKVELDYRNKVSELDETNNTATVTYSFLRGSLTLLTPTEFAIISNNRPRLTAQNNDPNAVTRSYDFEVDTVATFNSSKIQRGTVTSAPSLVSWQPPAALVGAKPDSVVWYWRVRLSAPTAAEDASWKVSSFRIISSVAGGGWSQSHYDQFKRDQLQQTAVAAPAGRWTFADQRLPIGLITAGGGAPGASSTFSGGYGILTDLSAPPVIGTCGAGSPNLMVLVLDGRSLQRLAVPGGPYSTCGSGTQTFYHFGSTVGDTLDNLNNSATRQQQLVTFLQNVPDGSYVALVSMNRLRYAAFPASLRNAFAQLLGSQLITTQLRNGEPWTLVAKKLATGGTLVGEHGPDRTLAQSTFTQLVSVVDTVRIPSQAGRVLSTRIGPAIEWQALFNVIKRETTASSYTLRLLGVDGNNMTQVLQPDIKDKTLSLTNVPAATYPYLQLEVTLRDSVTRVPPQLRQWLVTYKGLPEGAVRRDLVAAAAYDPATLAVQAADSGYIRFPVKFENIGGIDFAKPLTTRLDLINSNGVTVKSVTFTAASALKAGDVMTVPVKMNVVGIFGTLTPVVTVNPTPNQQPELYFFNNTLALAPYSIIDRNVPPTLDVAFDGRHLLNGDLVSPTPAINIQLRDEDRFRYIRDASYFTVLLQKPGATTATLIDPKSPELQFSADSTSQKGTVARLEYHPGKTTPLTDGVYTLQVQGRDRSSNSAGTQNYQVKFEVVNKSTITNVFPYPNPVTSKARFVFTVTGQELPRDMKIQIMTLTGQVVREIFMSELGPLHIGNNITDYAWDGTDQYGDRLANGTYLYRVSLNDPSGQFSQRATAGDQAFKKDWGKLVLLR